MTDPTPAPIIPDDEPTEAALVRLVIRRLDVQSEEFAEIGRPVAAAASKAEADAIRACMRAAGWREG